MAKIQNVTISKNALFNLQKKVVHSSSICREQSLISKNVKQLVRASGSIGANYIEANEAIGKKDFVMKIKICRREAKESRYWLRLIDIDGKLEAEQARLLGEIEELMKIFGAIVRKSEQ
jgi:four helix bundle protein